MTKYTIVATEHDGMETRTCPINVSVVENIDPILAIKAACQDYIATKEGRSVYTSNCDSFNWADFLMYVPNSICIMHGVIKTDDDCKVIDVDWDEQLAEPPEEREDDE